MAKRPAEIYEAARVYYAQGDMEKYQLLMNAIPVETRQALFNEDMKRQSMQQQVDQMGPSAAFMSSAGIQANRMVEGAKDFIGIGNEQQRAEAMSQYDMAGDMLYDRNPVSAFGGEVLGGAVAALPAATLAPSVSGAGALATAGRVGVSALLGGAEGGLEYPREGESRLENAGYGTLFGVFGEVLSNALDAVKRSRATGVLDDQAQVSSIRDALEQQGMNFDDLKPETKQFLSSLRGDVNIERAVDEAVQLEYGFKLTAGEAAQDFTQLSNEETAARMSGEAGDRLREFKVEQNRGIIAAADDMVSDAGGRTTSAESAGASIKQAMLNAQQNDVDAYEALYGALRDMAQISGTEIPIPTAGIESRFNQMVADHGSEHEALLMDIGRRLSEYGVLDPEQFRSSRLLEIADVDRGALSATNQMDVIKYLNSLYNEDPQRQRIIGQIKDAIEESSDSALDQLDAIPESQLEMMGLDPKAAREFINGARSARAAFAEYKGLWEARDVIDQLVKVKPGTNTPVKDPSQVVQALTSSPENTARVLEVLRNNNEYGAIEDLRTYVIKNMFDKAVNPNNINAVGEEIFSGPKLSSYIKSNRGMLEAVLSPSQFTQLLAFEDQVGKATKRPAGSVNQSNTAYKVMDFFFNFMQLKYVPLLSIIPEGAARNTIDEAVRDSKPSDFASLKLNDEHSALNQFFMGVLQELDPQSGLNPTMRQTMNVTQNNMMDEEERRGVLAQ